MSPANIACIGAALFLLLFVVFKTRKRTDRNLRQSDPNACSDRELQTKFSSLEANTLKLVELSREIEARVNNKLLMIEDSLEQADQKIRELQGLGQLQQDPYAIAEPKPEKKPEQHPIYEQVISMSEEGKSDQEIGEILSRSEGEIRLVRSLGKHHST